MDEATRMKIEKVNITSIIDAKQRFSEQGYTATHIIFPKPAEDYLYIDEGKFRVIEGREMGTVFGLKIYVDAKAEYTYLVDVNPFLQVVNDFVKENPPNFLYDNDFRNNFPSLPSGGIYGETVEITNVEWKKSIYHLCLDKEKVRQVIENFITEKNMGTAWANSWRNQILKELGL
jgi:hypothetical protein